MAPGLTPRAVSSPSIWDHPPMPAARKPRATSEKARKDSAHDVLAAEEFALPAPDPSLHHGPVTLPDDPSGILEPHDVLAAEEFALPAPGHRADAVAVSRRRMASPVARALGAGLTLVVALRLLRAPRKR
jgi:hypothetical protein